MSSYPERIKELMTEKGVDVTRLKDALGISYQAVRKVVELGGSFGSKNNLRAAEFFGVNAGWLANGVGPKYAVAGSVSTTLDGASGTPDLTAEAQRLGRLFDLIPEQDLIRRAVAYNAASAAIVSVLEGHKPVTTVQPAQGQKTQPA